MRTLYQIDAFTTQPFTGNAAGVVLDADGLTDDQMLTIAAELKNSETAFVFAAEGTDHDVKVRFFTPTCEVAACGHATVATHFARTVHADMPGRTLVQKTGMGLLQTVAVARDESGVSVTMQQGSVDFGSPIGDREVDDLLEVLGTDRSALDAELPVQVLSSGVPMLIVPLKSRAQVDELTPEMSRLTELGESIGCKGHVIFTLDTEDDSVLTHSRMFAPALGISEDPVTGMAHGPLGAYLARHELLPMQHDSSTFRGRQGVAMGRPGEMDVTVTRAGDAYEVSISGRAVVVYQAQLNI